MAVTQDEVFCFLLERGGRVRNADLLSRFKPQLLSSDPAEKDNNRELFKKFVSKVATVKDEDGGKFVVLKRKYWHLVRDLSGGQGSAGEPGAEPGGSPHSWSGAAENELAVVQEAVAKTKNDSPVRRSFQLQPVEEPEICPSQNVLASGGEGATEDWHPSSGTVHAKNHLTENGEDSGDDKHLQPEIREPRESVFALVARIDPSGPVPNPLSMAKGDKNSGEPVQKPHMLPVRCPQPPASTKDCGILPGRNMEKKTLRSSRSLEPLPPKSPHIKRRQSDESGSKSPHAKRMSKSSKVTEENRYSDAVPLEAAEHEWLVKTSSGHWSHRLHGLLLNDIGLAEKRDFMTGFTALHWAAKSGNTEMMSSIIDIARRNGSNLNVDIKSHGGYTSLHIAAMHGREDIIFVLVRHYNARVDLRDYSGKKAFQYLKKGSSLKARDALNDPHASNRMEQTIPIKRNSKVASSILGSTSTFLGVLSDDVVLHDSAKGLKKPPSLNKLFTASSAIKKRPKLRGSFPSVTSLTEEVDEENEEATERLRPVSAFFSH
ncbi:ankyrin repeat domain-containing protein SOWAHA [Microcaecilia unicolor]|uniref:Ankyrin repeat domain-containing protein SOWAHA n=1 Tax=Microcaecilia unicolor TaxID=1415580 RepID=A0A6P7YK28_9AMPH|nr:ankyrin repeat domain-containing protein SOWAHA [Microcaecilia unicolor]